MWILVRKRVSRNKSHFEQRGLEKHGKYTLLGYFFRMFHDKVPTFMILCYNIHFLNYSLVNIQSAAPKLSIIIEAFTYDFSKNYTKRTFIALPDNFDPTSCTGCTSHWLYHSNCCRDNSFTMLYGEVLTPVC